MGIRLIDGDWIVGFLDMRRQNRLLYAMLVKEVLHFNDYHKNPRFTEKIPNIKGNWKERVGDNMYYLGPGGEWIRHKSIYHKTDRHLKQDTRNPNVFISKHFFYFGEKAQIVPERFQPIVIGRQRVKCNHSPDISEKFINWLEGAFKPGIHAHPIDNPDLKKQLINRCPPPVCP